MRRGKKQQHMQQQLILEEYQDSPVINIRVEVAAEPDTDPDLGSLPGCIGLYDQPEPGYVCSRCCHQQICRTTTATPTAAVVER